MKKTVLSLLSLILAAIMLMSVFASCSWGNDGNDPEVPGENDGSESDSGDNSEIEDPPTPPDLNKIENGLLISHANSLMNGVNAFFTDGKRTDFMLENQNMSLEYALSASKYQAVTSLKNKAGILVYHRYGRW